MNKLLLLFLFVGFAVSSLRAQNVNIKQVTVDQEENLSLNGNNQVNLTYDQFYSLGNKFPHLGALYNISTTGAQAAAIITQIGDRNTSIIHQTGVGNYGAIYIKGYDNWTKMSQIGNDFSVLVVKGYNNHFEIRQTDPGVSSFIKLKHTYGVDMLAKQNANGMKLFLTGGTTPTMGITITGQNIPVIITTHY